MAENKLKYRTITIFSSFIASFLLVFFIKGIDLESYSIIIALSMSLGLIFFVLLYVKRYGISVIKLFGNFLKVASPLFIFAAIPFYMRQKGYTLTGNSGVFEFVFEILIFNIILVLIVWLFALNREEKRMLLHFKHQ